MERGFRCGSHRESGRLVEMEREESEVEKCLGESVEYFRAISNTGKCDVSLFVKSANVIAECCRKMDLKILERELFEIMNVLTRMLKNTALQPVEMEGALIDCLVSLGCQNNPELLRKMTSAGYLRTVESILSGVWRKRHDKEVYQMLVSLASRSEEQRQVVMGVIPPKRVSRSMNVHLDYLDEKCRLLAEYSKSVLTEEEQIEMVKAFKLCFNYGERDTLYYAACGLYHVIRRMVPVCRCFFEDGFLDLMTSKAAEHDRVTEMVIYVIMAAAKNTRKAIGVDMHFLFPFLESDVAICQIAAARCLSVIVNSSPEDLENVHPREILELIGKVYFSAPFSSRQYLNELSIAVFYRFQPTTVIPFIADQFMPIVCAMTQQAINDSLCDVLTFYRKLFDMAGAHGTQLEEQFVANEGLANLEVLLHEVQQTDLHDLTQMTELLIQKLSH